MTCVAGIEDDGKVWIGGDSAGADDCYLTIRADEKVWADGEFVFGFTASFRMGQLLRYKLKVPEHATVARGAGAEMRFMATEFIDAARGVLKHGGLARVENGVETGGTFLVGWRGLLYAVHSDFQVARATQGFYAVGSGGATAEGALYALNKTGSGLEAEEKLRVALRAASALVTTVAGPFVVVSS